MNNDGYLDIITANIEAPNVIYFGDANLKFSERLEFDSSKGNSSALAIGDLDLDESVLKQGEEVIKKAGEKSAAAQCDNRQIRPYPQGKSVRVVHIRLVKAFEPDEQHGKNTP